MAFTAKDWRDYPDTTTPVSAAALEDLEARLAAYADLASGLVYDSGLLSARSTDLTVSGLDGNTDQAYEITAVGRIASASAQSILVHPNGNTTADKRRTRQIAATNSTGTVTETNDSALLAGFQLFSALSVTASFAMNAKATFQARAGGVTNGRRAWLYQWTGASDLTTAEMIAGHGGAFWPNDADNITSLVFAFSHAFTGRIVIRRIA